DMLCLLRVELELSVQAKAAVMVREAGVILPVHDDARYALEEVQYLRASIGTTGILALKPLGARGVQVAAGVDRHARHPGAQAVRRDVTPRRLAPLPASRAGREAQRAQARPPAGRGR